tara:strand:- start:223 stop:999 length:777 start_codon:yes stop_codon:yes gene_type:complete
MRHFFKFIAVFLPFSFTLLSEEEIEIVKVEVATVIWKDQATSEKFEIVDENVLIGEALSLEKIEKPEINLEAIANDKEEIVFDFEYFEEIPEFIEEDITNEEVINIPSFFRVLDRKEHELNGTMRRISTVPDLELGNHKSWYQPLKDDMSTPYILISDQDNQCVVKVFQARFPRVHAKCAMGPDSLSNTYIMSKSEFNVKPLIGEFKLDVEESEIPKNKSELYVIDEQRRISLNELHYFDHPRMGILVGVYSYPKEED